MEQITKEGNIIQSIRFTLEVQNRNIEQLITYSIDEQVFKFKGIIDMKTPKTINLDELNNIELWGANFDLESYGKKWTVHDIIHNMGFHPTKANQCVMMGENPKTKSCEYIVVYVDDLYIASQTSKDIGNILKTKYKLILKTDEKLCCHLEDK